MAERGRQGGYAIAAISLLGLAAMSATAMMIQDGGVNEADLVEEQLVRTRLEWAQFGHMNYALSRARQDGVCLELTCDGDDGDRVDAFQLYLEEIYNARQAGFAANNTDRRRWQYDELGETYAVNTDATPVDGGASGADGRVALTIGPRTSNGNNFLQQIVLRSHDVEAVVCTGLAAAGDACLDTADTTNASGISRIEQFRLSR